MNAVGRTAPRVRRATADDVDPVAALEQAIFGADAWSRAGVAEEVTGSLRQAFVALDQSGEVCGYVVMLGVGDVADLQRIAVAPRHRGLGVATALLDACDASAHDRVVLEVRADNGPALSFYRRHGFAEMSRLRGYYADGVDAVVMQRVVPSSANR